VARFGEWIEPFHAFYSVDLKEMIEGQLMHGHHKIADMLLERPVDYVPESLIREHTPDWTLFRNLNAVEDLSNYLEEEDEEH
jgi:molybdopterin-guanine dinucleotide biosynthesis protein A